MRPLVGSIFLMILLAGCSVPTEISPRTGFNMIGATVVSPNEPGWVAAGSNPGRVQIVRRGEVPGETRFVYVMGIQVDASQSDNAFLSEAKRAKTYNDNPSRIIPQKTQTQNVTFKGSRCLKFDLLQQEVKSNSAVQGPQYVNTIGYTCRHPLRNDVAIEMVYSKRSTNSQLPKSERALAKQFFANVQFNDNYF